MRPPAARPATRRDSAAGHRGGQDERDRRPNAVGAAVSRSDLLEPTLGFEPRTCCLRNSCSTAELCRRGGEYRPTACRGPAPPEQIASRPSPRHRATRSSHDAGRCCRRSRRSPRMIRQLPQARRLGPSAVVHGGQPRPAHVPWLPGLPARSPSSATAFSGAAPSASLSKYTWTSRPASIHSSIRAAQDRSEAGAYDEA